MAVIGNIHLDRNNIEFDGVTVAVRIIPLHQVIKAIINHCQRIAQVLLTVFAPRQVGKIGGNTRIFRRVIVFIKTTTFNRKGKVCHRLFPPWVLI